MEKVVGLTGPIATGMWVVREILQERGFQYFSLADRVREEAQQRGLGQSRVILQDVGNRLRRELGSTVLMNRTVEMAFRDEAKRIIFDSLRHPDEVHFIQEKLRGTVIGVTAPVDVRFVLMQTRPRQIDPLVFNEFVEVDQVDFGKGQDNCGHNIPACLELADFLFEHQGDLEDLKTRVNSTLVKLF